MLNKLNGLHEMFRNWSAKYIKILHRKILHTEIINFKQKLAYISRKFLWELGESNLETIISFEFCRIVTMIR